MTSRPIIVTAALLLAASLGACSSRSERDVGPADNAAMEATDAPTPLPSSTPDVSMAAPEAGPGDTNAAAALPSADTAATNADAELPPPAPVDDQMMDDASATGMTARSSRGGGDHPSDDASTTGQTEPK